jgi:hypothetical protein
LVSWISLGVLCDGEKVVLIDFGWGGTVGKARTARYPRALHCSDLRDGRDGTDPRITKKDDERVLQTTLDELKIVASELDDTR